MTHDQYQTCIEACYACADACDHCAVMCLSETNVHEMARCIRLDLDCAAICRATAGCLARASELASAMCQLCAEVCDACGMECASHDAAHCQDSAQTCYRCAAECRRIAEASFSAVPNETTHAPRANA
jgi:hypothetical protein